MTYCVLVFQLGRSVEPHPFSWQVAPACYAHGVLCRDADETVIVPESGGVQAPPHVPADVEAARARAELGVVKPADHVPLLFWTRAGSGTRLPASVADACRTEGVLRAGETVKDAREVARSAMTAGIRDAVAEAHDREKAAAILGYAAQHDWYPECSLPTAYEQYLITDALAALRDLHDLGIPVPQATPPRPVTFSNAPHERRRAVVFEPYHELICPGTRIKLIATSDEHTHLTTGARGTVDLVDGFGTIHVTWDDGTKLGLVPGIDFYETIPRDDRPAAGD